MPAPVFRVSIGRSANGRQADFESVNLGSIPSLPACDTVTKPRFQQFSWQTLLGQKIRLTAVFCFSEWLSC